MPARCWSSPASPLVARRAGCCPIAKPDHRRSWSTSTTLGLALGAANAALLVEPTGADSATSVIGLLTAGTAIGATAGFFYGHAADLTSGQSLFVANLTLLGAGTAAFTAIEGSRDGKFGGWEDATLAIGIDGGAAIGAIVAPSLNWSPHRSRLVAAATCVGAFIGGSLVALLDTPQNQHASDASGDVVAAGMVAGMWGGFGLGILMTHDDPPDLRYAQPTQPGAASATVMPWIGQNGQLGMMAGGMF